MAASSLSEKRVIRAALSALMLLPMVGMLHAQSIPPERPAATIPVATDSSRSGLAAPLPPWRPVKPAVVRTVATITFINLSAAIINTLAREITPASPGTWWQNVQGGWNWDSNDIRVNELEHPWAGAAYFNSGRANGLSFWGSAPMALTGSLMWELFGESKPPAINDVLSTSLTGIALGEPLHQLSILVLDEESTGLDRFWREAVVFLTNPGMGLGRLSRGQSWTRRQNPLGRRPDILFGGMAVEARQYEWADGGAPLRTPVLSLTVEYGDPFAPGSPAPFAIFRAGMELMPSSPDGLGALNARGLLARFGAGDGSEGHMGGLFMGFDYRRDGAVEFAEQSFGVSRLSRSPLGGGFRLRTDVSAEAVPILAVQDPYTRTETRKRRYDFGAGAGARVLAELEYRGHRVLSAGGRVYWAPTLSGASGTKLVQLVGVEARLPPVLSLSPGAAYNLYIQRSTYETRPSETKRLSSLSLFLSTGR